MIVSVIVKSSPLNKLRHFSLLPLLDFTSFRSFSLVTVTTATDSGIPCLLQIIHGELDIVEARTSMVNLDLSDEEGGIDLSRQTAFRFAQKRVN